MNIPFFFITLWLWNIVKIDQMISGQDVSLLSQHAWPLFVNHFTLSDLLDFQY